MLVTLGSHSDKMGLSTRKDRLEVVQGRIARSGPRRRVQRILDAQGELCLLKGVEM